MQKPQIGIIMGSDSDLPVMKEAARFLDEFQLPYELTIVSAHRTPERMVEYAKTAVDRGLKVIIAGAGGAAHLPGMVAALTSLPVIGVPVQSRAMNGIDSLYSIVQMPPGVPVATVAINGARNAGILAVQILATHDPDLYSRLTTFKEAMRTSVEEKAAAVSAHGVGSIHASRTVAKTGVSTLTSSTTHQ
jgi:5-(carboxyamino)imidazole ribonucleotide mutase